MASKYTENSTSLEATQNHHSNDGCTDSMITTESARSTATTTATMNGRLSDSRRPRTSFILRFPLELMQKIVLFLDIYSVKSLLLAEPEIRQHFMIIIDTSSEDYMHPLFFNVPGIEVTSWNSFNPSQRGQRAPLIKLFELNGKEQNWMNTVRRADLLFPGKNISVPFADQSSFVVINCRSSRGEDVQKAEQLWLQGTHSIVSRRQSPPFQRTVHGPSTAGLMGLFVKLRLRELELMYVNNIANITFESLTKLHIFFGEQTGDTRPSIWNVKASKLKDLQIIYSNQLPRIYGCHFMVRSNKQPKNRLVHEDCIFELCQVDALDHARPNHTHGLSDFDPKMLEKNFDLEFTARCDVIRLKGGPAGLIGKISFERAKVVSWTLTDPDLRSYPTCLDTPRLADLTFECHVPKFKFPEMTSRFLQGYHLLVWCDGFVGRWFWQMVQSSIRRAGRAFDGLFLLTRILKHPSKPLVITTERVSRMDVMGYFEFAEHARIPQRRGEELARRRGYYIWHNGILNGYENEMANMVARLGLIIQRI